MTERPKRGRPKGSGKNDEPHLLQVAHLMIEDEALKPTTAMYRVIRQGQWSETDATLIRRWQVKWKDGGERFLATAKQEREAWRDTQERRSQQKYRKTSGMPDYIKAAMPQGYSIPMGIVDNLAFMKAPPGFDLKHLSAAMEANRAVSSAKKIMAEHDNVFRQHGHVMKALKQHEDIFRVTKEVSRVLAAQKFLKF